MNSISNVSLLQIEIFLRVSEYHNISQAAESMYICQSAVTRWIQKLESTLNVTLFNRTNRGMELTKEGRQLYRDLSRAFHITNEALLNAQTVSGERAERIRIGIMNVNEIYDLCSPAIKRFQNTHPEYTLDFKICTLNDIREGILSGAYDCIFSYSNALEDIAELEIRHFKKMDTFFALSSASPAAQDETLDISRLSGCHLYVYLQGQQYGATRKGLDVCLAHGFSPRKVIYVSERQELDEAIYDTQGIFVVGPGFGTRHGDKVRLYKADKAPDLDQRIAFGWIPERATDEVRCFVESIPCFKITGAQSKTRS